MLRKLANYLHKWHTSRDSSCAALAHPLFDRITLLVSGQSWQELEAEYKALSIEDRHFILNGIAEIGSPHGWYDEWIASGSNTAKLFLASTLTAAAWKARGGLRGRWVTASQAGDFNQLLSDAFDLLLEAHEKDPEDPEPVARLVRVMMGLGARIDQYYEAFERVISTGTLHLGAAWYMIDALSPKWHGDEQEMLSFARTQCARSGQFAALIPLAHIEIWLHLDMFQDDTSGAARYFHVPEVKDEILGSYDAHKTTRTTGHFDLLARNAFAFALWRMGSAQPAIDELEFIGARVSPKPWAYVNGNLHKAVNEARKSLGMVSLNQNRS